MSVLLCDSNCELWFDRAEELGLNYISMPYCYEGQEYGYDLGKQTDFKKFYASVRGGARTFIEFIPFIFLFVFSYIINNS